MVDEIFTCILKFNANWLPLTLRNPPFSFTIRKATLYRLNQIAKFSGNHTK